MSPAARLLNRTRVCFPRVSGDEPAVEVERFRDYWVFPA